MLRAARIPQLDGLRGVAILLVLCGHVVLTIPALTTGRFAHAGRLLSAFGLVGVNVFFVLSGYLITWLLVRELGRAGRIDLRAFYLRRMRRIFPAYYVFLVFVAVLAVLGPLRAVTPRDLLVNATYLTDYIVTAGWTRHSWSLAVEEQFYLLWPGLLAFVGVRRGLWIALGAIVLEPVVRIGTYFAFPSQRILETYQFHTRLDALAFGCALALALDLWPAFTESLPRRSLTWAAIATFAIYPFAEVRFRAAFTFTAGFSLICAATAILMLTALALPHGFLSRALGVAPLRWVGRISYSLYLWQQLFLIPADHSLLGRFPLNVVAAFAAACASYYLIERRFFKPVPVEAPAVSVRRATG